MKKIVVMVIAITLILGSFTISYADYSDVKGTNWAYDAVTAMSNQKIVKGYPDGTFKPNNTITYGEFIKMSLIAGAKQDIGNSSSGHWATNYYNKALELKYFTVNDIREYQLGSAITRGDMALIISSILGDIKIENYDEIQKEISDVTYQTKHEYDITKAYATGILTGYPDNTFKPEKTLTRAESATVIYRLVDQSKREIPGTETETGTKVDVTVGNKTYTLTSNDVKLGYNGIEKIEKQPNGDVWVYSTICHDSIRMYIDNVQMRGLSLTTADYLYQRDGYYIYDVYYAKASYNIAHPTKISGKMPSLTFGSDSDNIYNYTNVIL